jgi:DNA-binding NarL/FixJ family response regulator
MVTEVLKELQAAKAKVAELESELAKERRETLAGLPKEFGFESVEEFIQAVREASGSASRRRGRAAKASTSSGGKKRSKRARITPELKDQVKQAVQAGKTGAEIAKQFSISVPSVQNIKKEFGLVKSRK